MYVYQSFEKGLWTVGFYRPDGKWEPESDHNSSEKAAKRVAWLNGNSAVHAVLDEALNSGDGVYRP
jgi:hypothetical protein